MCVHFFFPRSPAKVMCPQKTHNTRSFSFFFVIIHGTDEEAYTPNPNPKPSTLYSPNPKPPTLNPKPSTLQPKL